MRLFTRCGVCKKIIWPLQKRIQVRWISKPKEEPEGILEYYHNPKCMSPNDITPPRPARPIGIEKALQSPLEDIK